jgi:hypothetical protein
LAANLDERAIINDFHVCNKAPLPIQWHNVVARKQAKMTSRIGAHCGLCTDRALEPLKLLFQPTPFVFVLLPGQHSNHVFDLQSQVFGEKSKRNVHFPMSRVCK